LYNHHHLLREKSNIKLGGPNPIVAFLVGAFLLREPLRLNLVAGIVAVFVGIALATRPDRLEIARRASRSPSKPPLLRARANF
jgi:hypothetical protein